MSNNTSQTVETESKNKLFQGVGVFISASPAILLVIFLYLISDALLQIEMTPENQLAFIDMINKMIMVFQDYGDKFLLLASNVLTAYGTAKAIKNN